MVPNSTGALRGKDVQSTAKDKLARMFAIAIRLFIYRDNANIPRDIPNVE